MRKRGRKERQGREGGRMEKIGESIKEKERKRRGERKNEMGSGRERWRGERQKG